MARLSKGINVALWDIERPCISLMKEQNRSHLLDEDGWEYAWTSLYYQIGCTDVTERIVNRLGNKQDKIAPGSCVGSQINGLCLGWKAQLCGEVVLNIRCLLRQKPQLSDHCDHTINGSEPAGADESSMDILLLQVRWMGGWTIPNAFRKAFYVWTAKVQAPLAALSNLTRADSWY